MENVPISEVFTICILPVCLCVCVCVPNHVTQRICATYRIIAYVTRRMRVMSYTATGKVNSIRYKYPTTIQHLTVM